MREKLESIGVVLQLFIHIAQFLFSWSVFWRCNIKNCHMHLAECCGIPHSRATYRKQYRRHTQCSNFRANIFCSQGRRRELALEWNKKTQPYFCRSQPYYSVSQKIFNVRQAFQEENLKVHWIEMATKCLKVLQQNGILGCEISYLFF